MHRKVSDCSSAVCLFLIECVQWHCSENPGWKDKIGGAKRYRVRGYWDMCVSMMWRATKPETTAGPRDSGLSSQLLRMLSWEDEKFKSYLVYWMSPSSITQQGPSQKEKKKVGVEEVAVAWWLKYLSMICRAIGSKPKEYTKQKNWAIMIFHCTDFEERVKGRDKVFFCTEVCKTFGLLNTHIKVAWTQGHKVLESLLCLSANTKAKGTFYENLRKRCATWRVRLPAPSRG